MYVISYKVAALAFEPRSKKTSELAHFLLASLQPALLHPSLQPRLLSMHYILFPTMFFFFYFNFHCVFLSASTWPLLYILSYMSSVQLVFREFSRLLVA